LYRNHELPPGEDSLVGRSIHLKRENRVRQAGRDKKVLPAEGQNQQVPADDQDGHGSEAIFIAIGWSQKASCFGPNTALSAGGRLPLAYMS
jgi:hypothetical protein